MMAVMYGQILRKLREAKGRAQADVARKAEISPAQLARLEMDQRGLYVEDFVRIAEVLGEKPGNLLPNDLGYLGHLKPLIDCLAGLPPEFLGRVEAILETIVLLTNDVITTTRLMAVHDSHLDHDHRRKMPARAIARLEKLLERAGSTRRGAPVVRFSGAISAEKGMTVSDGIRGPLAEIPKWAVRSGATGVFRAVGSSMNDVGILDGDTLFVRPDANPLHGKLVICTVDDRVFVKIVKRDRSGRPAELVSRISGWPPIDIRPGDHVKFYCVVVGIAGHR